MRKILLTLLLTAACGLLPSCAPRKPKSSARLYSGDAPTIKYSENRESAGGNLNTY